MGAPAASKILGATRFDDARQVLIACDDRGAARQLLAPVYDWFTDGLDTTPDLKAARALLAD
jgi:hypothetical protein